MTAPLVSDLFALRPEQKRSFGLLLGCGFTQRQAWELVLSGPDTVFLVPLTEREPEPTLDPA